MKKIIYKLNVSRVVCNHLFSKSHTENHRMVVGGCIIFIGVFIGELSSTIHVVSFLMKGVGGGIHAIGCTPFLEKLLNNVEEETKEVGEVVEKEIEKDLEV